MLTIRLRRVGRKNQPSYRVVVTEHTRAAKGNYLEAVGHFNPRVHQLTVDKDRVLAWLNQGAQPSERMAKLLTTAGVEHKLLALPDYTRKPKKTAKKAAPAPKATADSAETPAAPESTEAAPEEAAPAVEESTVEEAPAVSPESGSSDQADQSPDASPPDAASEEVN